MLKRKPKILTPEQAEEIRTKDFFDMILPGTVKFLSDHYIVGNSYRCVWAVREYPPSTEEQAILSQLADRNGVTLRIYHRLVESMEQRKIIQNATRRNRLKSGGNDVNETIEAEGNLQDVIELLANLRKNKEPLLHCSVFIELKAQGIAIGHCHGADPLQNLGGQADTAAKGGLPLRRADRLQPVRRTVRACASCVKCCKSLPIQLFRQDRSAGRIYRQR